MNSPKRFHYASTPPSSPGTPASDPVSLSYPLTPSSSWGKNTSRSLKSEQKWKSQTATTAALFNTMNLHQACKSSKFNIKVLSSSSSDPSGRAPRRLVRRHKQFTYWNQISKLTDDSDEPESDRCELYHA